MGMVRIFMSPKNDERGAPMLFRDQRLMMIEMDKFIVSRKLPFLLCISRIFKNMLAQILFRAQLLQFNFAIQFKLHGRFLSDSFKSL